MSNINTADIDKTMEFINKASKLLPEIGDGEYFVKLNESVKNAKDVMADNAEKAAILLDIVVKNANQLVFTLFRDNALTEDIEKEYRELPLVQETDAKVKEFASSRKEAIERINDERASVVSEEQGIEIFRAVIGGMTLEEAKAKMAEYEKQLEAAKAQVARA